MDETPRDDQLEDRVEHLEHEVADLHAELRELREEFATTRRAIMRRFGQLDRLEEELSPGPAPEAGTPPPEQEEDPAVVEPEAFRDGGREEDREPPRESAWESPSEEEEEPEAAAPSTASAGGGRTGAKRTAADLEDWVGRNALLAVGLLALVAGAAFLLKHAFDQGWISPGLRVVGGLVVGLAVAAWGEWIQQRGMLRYGSALVAGGAAMAYLAVWAAAGPYSMVAPWVGIAGLAALAAMVFASAAVTGVELLAGLAAAGAFGAPLILPGAEGSARVLLAYLASVGLAAGSAAVLRGWRITLGLVLAGYFLLPAVAGELGEAPAVGGVVYLAAGGGLALWATHRRGWDWIHRGVFVAAWPLAGLFSAGRAAETTAGSWAALALLPALAAPTFLRTLRLSESREGPGGAAPVALAVAALAWTGATVAALPAILEPVPLVAVALIAAPFVWVGERREAALFHAVGFALLAWGLGEQLEPVAATAGWAGLAVVSAWLNRAPHRAGARWTGAALLGLAALALFTVRLDARPPDQAVLMGAWSWALYAVAAGFALAAGPLWGREPGEGERRYTDFAPWLTLRGILWGGALAVVFGGGTAEVVQYFGPAVEAGQEGARLARDLAVSAWWLIFAGVLVGTGFWADRRTLRMAGLVASGAAVLKVALYDLTRLDALYRVASLVLLAVILLAAAWAYDRRDSSSSGGEGSPR